MGLGTASATAVGPAAASAVDGGDAAGVGNGVLLAWFGALAVVLWRCSLLP
jgi:hypothetical protein